MKTLFSLAMLVLMSIIGFVLGALWMSSAATPPAVIPPVPMPSVSVDQHPVLFELQR